MESYGVLFRRVDVTQKFWKRVFSCFGTVCCTDDGRTLRGGGDGSFSAARMEIFQWSYYRDVDVYHHQLQMS
jgi:hypothetical protein